MGMVMGMKGTVKGCGSSWNRVIVMKGTSQTWGRLLVGDYDYNYWVYENI